MNPKLAQYIFILLNVLAIPCLILPILTILRVWQEATDDQAFITFDSGEFYLLIMTVFWVMALIQYAGLKGKFPKLIQNATGAMIGWLAFTLILANLIPSTLTNHIEQAGYQQCDIPKERARIAKGEELIFSKDCQKLLSKT